MPRQWTHDDLVARIESLERQVEEMDQVKADLSESEARFSRLSQNMLVAVYSAIHTSAGTKTTISGHMEPLTGYTTEQFNQDADLFLRILHPDDRERVAQKIREAVRQCSILELEYRIVTRDNHVRWIRDKAAPVSNEGKCALLEGFFEDITHHRQTESDLKNVSKQWLDTFNTLSEAICLLDGEGRMVQCNRSMQDLINKTKSEIIGRHCWEVLHDMEAPIPECPIPKAMKSKQREMTVIDLDQRRFEVTVDPQLDEAGQINGYIHIMSDITEQQQAEIALRDAHQTFLTVLDSIDATIYVADMETYEILFVNRYMRKTFGGDYTGQTCWRAFHKKNEPCANCTNAKLVDTEGRPTGVCAWEGRNPGTGRWYVNYDRAIKWPDGRLVRLQVATDITDIKTLEKERQHAESQLRQAQKMEAIGTLAGGIAHDFNNILSAILGYSELALDDARSGQPSARYIRQILKAGHRARDLVHQILTFSRQTETEVKPIQIKPIIKEALKLLRASLPSSIDISTAIQSEAIVEADPIQVHQVIMNLCTNAGHAMRDQGGTLTVTLTEEELDDRFTERHPETTPGEYLKLTVSDTGPGMDKAIIDKIFDPYFTTKTKDEGTGMGLAVVQGIIKTYKGAVSVASTPGEGSAFEVYFPIIHSNGTVSAESKIVVPGGHERILFVDDELPLADLSQQLLERLGYKVTVRTSAVEALNLFENDPDAFDLVITDMTMPHMTGDILAEKLLALRPDVAIVICTGYSDKITQELIDRLNIRALVMKPIIRNELLITVRQVLDEQNE